MMAFSKADNFEITTMLLDEKDKKNVSAIIDKLKAQIDKKKMSRKYCQLFKFSEHNLEILKQL